MENENIELSPIALNGVTNYSVDKNFDSDKFIKMELYVMHDGLNLNKTIFHEKGMKNAKNSVYNIPILGHVVVDKNGNHDFDGHDKHIEKTKDKKIKVVYDELPIGLVPESTRYEIVEKEGKKWVIVDAYIWKGYSNYAEDIINEKETIPLSMEIFADKFTFDKKSKTFDISEFRYKAITFLGNEATPAMANANGTLNFSKEANDLLASIKEMLNKELESYGKGGNGEMDKAELNTENELEVPVVENEVVEEGVEPIADEENTEEVVESTVAENETVEEATEEVVVENETTDEVVEEMAQMSEEFATYRELREALSKSVHVLDVHTEELHKNNYVVDFDDTFVIYEINIDKKVDKSWIYERKFARRAYKYDKGVAKLLDDEVEMIHKFVTIEESEEINKQREELNKEFASLKEYKENVEKEIRENAEKELFAKFDNTLKGTEEYEVLKDEAEKYSIQELEEKCYSLHGRMTFSTQNSESKKNSVVVDYGMDDQQGAEVRSPYGYMVDKYYK